MATIEITEANHDETIKNHEIVVLDFWAAWCGPCRRFAPIFEAASDDPANAGIAFGKVDTEAQQLLASRYGIQSIPSTVFYRDGIPLHMQPGLLPKQGLEDLIKQVRGLDMDKVRQEMAERQAES